MYISRRLGYVLDAFFSLFSAWEGWVSFLFLVWQGWNLGFQDSFVVLGTFALLA
jgi:hypothetical protein